MELPRIISVDDHVIEPAHVWQEFLPERFRERGPRVQRIRGHLEVPDGPIQNAATPAKFVEDDSSPWVDCWVYDDLRAPFLIFGATAAFNRDAADVRRPVVYEDIRLGCYDRSARLSDMDLNHTEASLCFPTFPRFCGQTFMERQDKELALACVRAYNDWMIDDWCAGDAYGRLIPLTLVPLWDADLAAAEVRRCAAKGSHSIAFTENPVALGLPSIHKGYWDPMFAACEETDTVISMHIGSSSRLISTGPDAPFTLTQALTFSGSMHAVLDWVTSGAVERFSGVRIALSEGQVGWMPFLFERLDNGWKWAWDKMGAFEEIANRLPRAPSSYIEGRIYGCVYDDLVGLKNRDQVGMNQIMFETDFPHGDSTWPESLKVAENLITEAGMNDEEAWKLLRGNAIECYRLDRYGITK